MLRKQYVVYYQICQIFFFLNKIFQRNFVLQNIEKKKDEL